MNVSLRRVCVSFSLEERLSDSSVTEVVVDVCGEQTSVPVIGDMTSIVDSSDKVLQCVPGNLLVFIQVKPKQTLTHLLKRDWWHQEEDLNRFQQMALKWKRMRQGQVKVLFYRPKR